MPIKFTERQPYFICKFPLETKVNFSKKVALDFPCKCSILETCIRRGRRLDKYSPKVGGLTWRPRFPWTPDVFTTYLLLERVVDIVIVTGLKKQKKKESFNIGTLIYWIWDIYRNDWNIFLNIRNQMGIANSTDCLLDMNILLLIVAYEIL